MSAAVLESARRATQATRRVSALIELRRYTLHPGRRDTLIDLFEREFIETQERCGIELLGQFRDLDAPDRFVWLRGFPDPARRAVALAAFYGGPAWRAHREAANATMIDSDDVLQLRPCRPVGGFALPGRGDAEQRGGGGILLAHLYPLRNPDPSDFLAFFERTWVPMLWDANVGVGASYVTDARPNEFPALPVRDGSRFVWFSRHADVAQADAARARISEALDGSPALAAQQAGFLAGEGGILRLVPTARSRLRA